MSANVSKRVGVLGGTFNPIHRGHLEIARIALSGADLDGCLFIPDNLPPHKKDDPELAPAASRFAMTALSLSDEARMSVSDIELRRSGETFTIDTLHALKAEDDRRDLFLIIGSDALFTIQRWRDARDFSEFCGLIVVPRAGTNTDILNAQAEAVRSLLGIKVVLTDQAGPAVSSSAIRHVYTRDGLTSDSVPAWADLYIRQHGLYGSAWHPLSQRLRLTISPHRFEHTLAVADEAVILSNRFGADVRKAYLAGMLHDCAKGLTYDEALRLTDGTVDDLDDQERAMPELMHAPAGAVLAQKVYDVHDSEILDAIRWHTTGHAGMSKLQKIIYLADMIEPTRKPFDGLDELRRLSLCDLDEAVRLAANQSINYVRGKGAAVHVRTNEMLRALGTTNNS